MMEVVAARTGTCKAPVRSSPAECQHAVSLQEGEAFLSPNQQRQSTEDTARWVGTKLYCLVTEARVRERLAQGCCTKAQRAAVSRTCNLSIASPAPCRIRHLNL